MVALTRQKRCLLQLYITYQIGGQFHGIKETEQHSHTLCLQKPLTLNVKYDGNKNGQISYPRWQSLNSKLHHMPGVNFYIEQLLSFMRRPPEETGSRENMQSLHSAGRVRVRHGTLRSCTRQRVLLFSFSIFQFGTLTLTPP